MQGGPEDSKVTFDLVVAPLYQTHDPLEPNGLSGVEATATAGKGVSLPPQRQAVTLVRNLERNQLQFRTRLG